MKELRDRKNGMISALYANTNFDGEDSKRPDVIREIEEHFENAIDIVYGGQGREEEDAEKVASDPFFAPIRNLPKIDIGLPTEVEEQQGWFPPEE